MAGPFNITTEKRVFSKTVEGSMDSGGRHTSIKATAGVFGTRYEVLTEFQGITPHYVRRNDQEPPGYAEVQALTVHIFYADGSRAGVENRQRVKLPIDGLVAVGDDYSLGASGGFDAIFSLIRANAQLRGALKLFKKVAEEVGDIKKAISGPEEPEA